MAFGKWNAVIEELRVQRERSEREWALTRQELRVSRRTCEESLALCTRIVERNEAAFDRFSRVMAETVAETRAQTQAIFKLIDRMDRLDGGSQTA